MGHVVQYNHACADTALCVVHEIQKKMVKFILKNDIRVCFMANESTTTIFARRMH
jgi:hypothetical protein